MQGDPVRPEHGLTSRVRALSQKGARTQAIRDQVRNDLDAKTQEIDELGRKIDVLVKVGELFRALMDRLVQTHVKSVESVVTEGLRTIFHNQDLSFEAEIVQRYNRIWIDFFISQSRSGGKFLVRGHPLESFGGGPASIASFVLRLVALLKLKRWPLLLLDETMAAISPEYIDQTGQFLKKLATSTNTPILLVTHKHEFLDHATIAYNASEEVSAGQPRLSLTLVRGTV